MNFFDRGIAAIAPRLAVKRAVARTQLAAIERVTARENRQRRGDNWGINDPRSRVNVGPGARKAMLSHDRARIRDTFRVNPFARKIKSTLLNSLVGYGIVGTPSGSRKVAEEWAAWLPFADYDGIHDLYGLQELSVWTMFQDGECFVIKRIVAPSAVNPLRLQILRVEQLDTTKAEANIRDGVEYGADGRPVAYHFRRSLDDGLIPTGGMISERILARDVIHLFRREEPGQWRGRSAFEAILDPLDDADDYLEAEGVRKKIEACFVGMVRRSVDADPAGLVGEADAEAAPEGAPRVESFYPGMIHYLDQGEEITFGEPKASEGLGEFMRWGSLRAAAGADVTYEGMTGDLSNVNFTSHRAGQNEFKRFVGRTQWLCVIPLLCGGIADAWCDAGFATGRIAKRVIRFTWTPPRFESVNPLQDAKADIAEISAGLSNLREKLGERGQDHDQFVETTINDWKARQAEGVTFVGDPGVKSKEPDNGGNASSAGA